MAERDGPPKALPYQHMPPVAPEPSGGKMLGDEKNLVSGQSAYNFPMPAPQSRAPAVKRDRLGNIDAIQPGDGATDAEIDVFQIGLKSLIEQTHLFKDAFAE